MSNKLRKLVDKVKPHFLPGGKLEKLHSVFDGFETFLFVPNTTASKKGAHIRDAIDSKRTMSVVIVALLPALLFGMYNVGYQHYLAIGQDAGFWSTFVYGLLAVLPIIIVSYVVGLGNLLLRKSGAVRYMKVFSNRYVDPTNCPC